MPNEIYRFTLNGWKAVIFLVLIAGWYGLRVYMNMQPVSDGQRQVIEEFLAAEYSGNSPQGLLRQIQAANAGQHVESLPANQLHVSLQSAAARGNSSRIIVRVEVEVDGHTPPDGQTVRFLTLSHQADKWVVLWNSTASQYSRALWSRI